MQFQKILLEEPCCLVLVDLVPKGGELLLVSPSFQGLRHLAAVCVERVVGNKINCGREMKERQTENVTRTRK